ncbi:MAG: Sua5/YciO/YrdC/YwlC family protein [Microgenomates group bacterium GW2011_GWC1_43_11]|uniref:L-threonylcarbamoyladenylate synthase n=2 Tax=Candidatus Gottesmaniibacteriota TaxID=1752720 RepID=A0A0G1IRI4_9BACT|nr:MAG: Sua5/YciO/YrdC/YwlC family protein [Microgenomates group bacterium GW2011_GWC1_43_11]KKT39090.1 MAG: Sua5/YciO/YrdC/YwlC family protein [Candidatus Gottesmanbacteria bacterium GW2011_GWB1_44_11c]KKT61563.1 MAG: Sua5/YciO/YrdC/YwlC family protein [Candidatus Gottesmanbacteria bacterium GW2011_GWA1_44_24b]
MQDDPCANPRKDHPDKVYINIYRLIFEIMVTDVQQAITILKKGGIVIFPTDTAFGIGCRIDDTNAVDRLFEIRKRPRIQATPVLVSSIRQALPYLDSPSDIVRHLMKTYWPGGLTIIAPCKKNTIYSPIRGGGDTVGIRMPDHSDILTVITAVGVPILGPSANLHKEKTPYSLEDLDPVLTRQVDYVLRGTCKEKTVSTVVDCTVDPYRIIRQGVVVLPKKPVTLYIDSSNMHETTVAVSVDNEKKETKFVSDDHTSQHVLPLIESLLLKNNLTFQDISAVEVHTGPGSFTGLRVGAAVGNVLGWLLDVPVNRKKTPVTKLDYGNDHWEMIRQ